VHTNGTEKNKDLLPYPDTEDLNLNNNLDTNENYFEFTIDLGDTTYLVTDIQRDYPGYPSVTPDNGWRRYQIPIDAPERHQFGAPDLALARHMRVWIEGLTEPDPPPSPDPEITAGVQRPLFELGGILIAGEFRLPSVPGNRSAALGSPWPNPAREIVNFTLLVARSESIDLTVYDLRGRRVRLLRQGTIEPGRWTFTWDGRDAAGARVPPGLYLIEARGPSLASSAKVLVIK
jgi:hypothetical protein